MTSRIARLRRIAAEHDITLTRHPERHLAPLFARDAERWEEALAADTAKRLAQDAAEDAQIAAALGCVAPVSTGANPRLCGKPAGTTRTVEGLACALCAKHAAELDSEK